MQNIIIVFETINILARLAYLEILDCAISALSWCAEIVIKLVDRLD